jgi:oxygen-dependent protoporphyrinogen oxidase
MARVGIIGGGISGLTAAYRLRQNGVPVRLFEASGRVGGVIETTRSEGFLVEHGPNSLRPNDLLASVIGDLDLAPACVPADDTADTRYVVRDGRPVALPMSVGSFLTTDLFSTRAKLRLLAEPFIGRAGGEAEESLAHFVRRRLGPEVLDYAVAPFVGGVFAGRPESLSARHAFGRLVELEDEYGSLFWGALRSSRGGSGTDDTPSGLFSFEDGLETLPRTLAAAVEDAIQRNAPVTALDHDGERWRLTVEPGAGSTASVEVDAVISTVPLHALPDLALNSAVDRGPLHDVHYPPVHVVALGYDREDVAHPLDGFGMLVPPIEEPFDILGTIFSSTLFPGRAPDGQVLLTTFVGGARAPGLTQQPPADVQALVERDLGRLLGVDGPPCFAHHVHWPQAIPQYTLGYGDVTDTLDALEARHDGLFFAGNYREGVSVGDAMASGAAAAERAIDRIGPPV